MVKIKIKPKINVCKTGSLITFLKKHLIIIVFMISKSGAMAYPEEANSALNAGIKFSMGEPFAVSRLRPTNAEFSLRPVGDEIKFLIYIFSREGDLLLVKESETYKNGTK